MSPAHLLSTGFPTVTQGHDCTGAVTSGKSNDKVKIELCSPDAGDPAEVLVRCSKLAAALGLPGTAGGR